MSGIFGGSTKPASTGFGGGMFGGSAKEANTATT
jgi:hypothetical protein